MIARHVIAGAAAWGLFAGLVCGAPPVEVKNSELLKQARAAALSIKDEDERADTLNSIVMIQARTRDFVGAKQVADSIKVPLKKQFAYSHLAMEMSRAGDIAGATKLAEAADEDAQSGMFAVIAETLATRGDIKGANAVAPKVTMDFHQAALALSIAKAQAAANDLKAAEATVLSIKDANDMRVKAFAQISEQRTATKDKAGALRMLNLATKSTDGIPDYLLPLSLADIIGAQMKLGMLKESQALVATMTSDNGKILGWDRIIAAQIEARDFKAAVVTAQNFKEAADQCDFQASLATAQAKTDPLIAQKALASALALFAKIDAAESILTLRANSLATAMALVESPAKAADWARAQKDTKLRAHALLGVVEASPDYHKPTGQ